jgi:gluconolactonase
MTMAGDQDDSSSPFKVHDNAFKDLMGPDPKLELLLEVQEYPFAHEAGVFIESSNELFVTSNRFRDPSGVAKIQISKIKLDKPVTQEEVFCDAIHHCNGGVNYQDGILFCAQGSLTAPSGLFKMSTAAPYQTEEVVTTFYGRPFNSVNDVVVHKDGSIWFTDPIYGFDQCYRPRPQLPQQLYRFDPEKRSIRAMADSICRPNGLCFSPDFGVLYVTDTDRIHMDGPREGVPGSIDGSRASTMCVMYLRLSLTSNTYRGCRYAFDVKYHHGEPSLVNKRLFAMADTGVPDGIKCDTSGNVYSGCGDGINVWSPGGVLLGRILVNGGAANFCFGRKGELFILNENRLWSARIDPSVEGALLNTST